MSKLIIFLCIIMIHFNCHTQIFSNNWVFGDSAGLVFSGITPNSFETSILTHEACASISDESGNLLFYTNGETVWNSENNIMANGSELNIGYIGDYGSSVTQGVIIIPMPGNTNKYYIFQLQQYDPVGLKYSIVDIELNGGLGEVIEKNISVYENGLTEKMYAVKHANGRDWWVITSGWPNLLETSDSSLVFVNFLITTYGVEGPIEQVYGPNALEFEVNYNGWGEMVISESGNKLAYTRQNKIDLYNFDRCSGNFSGLETVSNLPNLLHYGCSFSPDGNMLYVSSTCGASSSVYQFCLDCKENIDSTRELIFNNPFNNFCIGQHELGPDGKIYISLFFEEIPSNIFNTVNQNLCVINNPNELYPFCDFDTNTISLGERRVIAGLPNMPNYNLGALVGSECDTITTLVSDVFNLNEFSIVPNPSRNEIYISNNLDGQSFDISIVNATGKQIFHKKEIQVNEPIDISKLKPGIYLVQLFQNDSEVCVEKLVVY